MFKEDTFVYTDLWHFELIKWEYLLISFKLYDTVENMCTKIIKYSVLIFGVADLISCVIFISIWRDRRDRFIPFCKQTMSIFSLLSHIHLRLRINDAGFVMTPLNIFCVLDFQIRTNKEMCFILCSICTLFIKMTILWILWNN